MWAFRKGLYGIGHMTNEPYWLYNCRSCELLERFFRKYKAFMVLESADWAFRRLPCFGYITVLGNWQIPSWAFRNHGGFRVRASRNQAIITTLSNFYFNISVGQQLTNHGKPQDNTNLERVGHVTNWHKFLTNIMWQPHELFWHYRSCDRKGKVWDRSCDNICLGHVTTSCELSEDHVWGLYKWLS